jgi:hypothetical protein
MPTWARTIGSAERPTNGQEPCSSGKRSYPGPRAAYAPARVCIKEGILCALWHLCSQAHWRCASSIPHRRLRGVRRNTPIQTKALIPPRAVARARRASAVVIKKFSTRGISTRGTSSVHGTYIRASKRLTCAACQLPVPVAVGAPIVQLGCDAPQRGAGGL